MPALGTKTLGVAGHPGLAALAGSSAGAVRPMALLLGHLPGIEQVELDPAGNSGDAGLAGLAGREVAGFPGFRGLARSGRSRTAKSGILLGSAPWQQPPTKITLDRRTRS